MQDSAKRRRRELIKVEDKFKGSVKGKEAAKLRHISAQSGARVILDREDLEIYIISGTEEEREYAKVLIGEKVVGKVLFRSNSNEIFKCKSTYRASQLQIGTVYCYQQEVMEVGWGAGGGALEKKSHRMRTHTLEFINPSSIVDWKLLRKPSFFSLTTAIVRTMKSNYISSA